MVLSLCIVRLTVTERHDIPGDYQYIVACCFARAACKGSVDHGYFPRALACTHPCYLNLKISYSVYKKVYLQCNHTGISVTVQVSCQIYNAVFVVINKRQVKVANIAMY